MNCFCLTIFYYDAIRGYQRNSTQNSLWNLLKDVVENNFILLWCLGEPLHLENFWSDITTENNFSSQKELVVFNLMSTTNCETDYISLLNLIYRKPIAKSMTHL